MDPGAARVADWGRIWDETYGSSSVGSAGSSSRPDFSGWVDSATGEPIPETDMREWLDTTLERLRAFKPRRVLEIGSGTGMILHGLLAGVERYTATDVSAKALDSIRGALPRDASEKVTLLHEPAHATGALPAGAFDLVVLNSVAQYFPGAVYFAQVLRHAVERVADGGRIFVGDVRSLAHLEAFHTVVELERASAGTDAAAIRSRIAAAVARETELVVSDAFFHAFARNNPRVSAVDVHLKRGTSSNEMTRFRYDVVLHVGPIGQTAPSGGVPRSPASDAVSLRACGLDEIRAALGRTPDMVWATDILNARLTPVAAVRRKLASADADLAALRHTVRSPGDGVDPETLYALDGYDVQLRWALSGDWSRFDAVLRRGARREFQEWPTPAVLTSGNPEDYANAPATASDATTVNDLRSHARGSLPEFMIPDAFVMLDALPLTPNGKVDRNALPAPASRARRPAGAYAAPATDLERDIAEVWRDLLSAPRIGRRDNIFDLGANSLLTMQASSRISERLGRRVSLVSMFRFPTVESLAAHLGENGADGTPRTDPRAQARAASREQAAERRRALRANTPRQP
jgi:SAM-dependent methyltransferase